MKYKLCGLLLFMGLTFIPSILHAQTAQFLAEYLSAKSGDPLSQYNLGQIYREGEMVEQDNAKAAYWYNKAADQGNPHAQYNLGVCYRDGVGVPQNSSIALMWFHKASVQGHASAQNNLAVMYATGDGIGKNESEAFKWFLKAANQGVVEAQISVAKRYASGNVVPRDLKKAYFWYSLAAASGSLIGRMTASGIEKELSVFEITNVKQKLEKWHPEIVLQPLPFASAAEALRKRTR